MDRSVSQLPLVAFEKYMLAENSPSYPRSFVVQLQLSGNLQREPLEAAWDAALQRHPLLKATLEPSQRGWMWKLDNPRGNPIDWAGAEVPLGFANGEMIDLTREPGVRLWARVVPDSARLVLQFHHSACDGIGGLLAVRDLLVEYARRTGSTGADLPPLDPELLRTRDGFHIGRLGLREWLGHVGATIAEAVRLVGRRPVPLAAPSGDGWKVEPPSFPGLLVHTLTPDEVASMHAASQALGVTMNDLIVAYALGAIADWNKAHGGARPRDWLRINMPTNLRMPGDERMPAANVMSFAFIDRRAGDCGDLQRLVKSIQAETEAIKSGRRGLYFIAQLGILSAIPGAMGLALSPRKCFATAVVSNVGDLGRMFSESVPRDGGKVVLGNVTLESITGTPPLRPLTRAGIGLLTYAGRMSVCLLCDQHHFTSGQSQQLLEMILRRVLSGIRPPAIPAQT